MTDPIIDLDLVEHLDDATLRICLDAATDEDRPVFLAEMEHRGLTV